MMYKISRHASNGRQAATLPRSVCFLPIRMHVCWKWLQRRPNNRRPPIMPSRCKPTNRFRPAPPIAPNRLKKLADEPISVFPDRRAAVIYCPEATAPTNRFQRQTPACCAPCRRFVKHSAAVRREHGGETRQAPLSRVFHILQTIGSKYSSKYLSSSIVQTACCPGRPSEKT